MRITSEEKSNIEKGNVEVIDEYIWELDGADLFNVKLLCLIAKVYDARETVKSWFED